MYNEMAGRHSARAENIFIIKTVIQPPGSVVRDKTRQFNKKDLKYPKFTSSKRAPTLSHGNIFTAKRPTLL
jgi:hypothetical protein